LVRVTLLDHELARHASIIGWLPLNPGGADHDETPGAQPRHATINQQRGDLGDG
jgi:hypothetical protein